MSSAILRSDMYLPVWLCGAHARAVPCSHDICRYPGDSLDRIRALDQIKTKNKRPDTLAGADAAAVTQQLAADDADAAPLPLAAA